MIFQPVLMCSWTELQPTDHLNAILHRAAAQAEVMKILDAQFHPENYDDLERVCQDQSVNIVSRGLASMVMLLKNPFHCWVFIMCAIVTVYLVHKV